MYVCMYICLTTKPISKGESETFKNFVCHVLPKVCFVFVCCLLYVCRYPLGRAPSLVITRRVYIYIHIYIYIYIYTERDVYIDMYVCIYSSTRSTFFDFPQNIQKLI